MKTEQNIDQAELDKFADMASQWWDKEGPCKPLHDINPVRLEYIKNNVPLEGKKILDVGCGGGILSESLASAGGDVTAIDLNKTLIDVAKAHLLIPGQQSKLAINYQHISIDELAKGSAESYDIVTCMELLEHVPEPKKIIEACAKCLKPGGKLFLSTLNRTVKAYLFAIIGAEYLLQLLPQGTHDYSKFIQPSEIDSWSREANLTLSHLSGLSYNLLTRDYYLSDNVSVNYMGMCTRSQESGLRKKINNYREAILLPDSCSLTPDS